MQTRINPKNGEALSILGYGCMRFPTVSGDAIDEPAARQQLLYAIDRGVNYLDTAYIYHKGKSESFVGKVIKEEGLRRDVRLATKMPTFMIRRPADLDKIFDTQLQRIQTDYVDYYLMHMLSDTATWEKLCKFGIEDWIASKKESGAIRNIGFSFHGGQQQFIDVVDAYNWEFTQVQYNYFDENNQAGRAGIKYASDKGLGTIVMEPLRGGKLVTNLPPALEQHWKNERKTPVEAALNWIWDQPEIMLLLSGMSTQEQVEQNVALASKATPGMLTEADLAGYKKAQEILTEAIKVPCTGCNYCMPCPHGVDIPTCFASYNAIYSMDASRFGYLQATGAMSKHPAWAANCTQCGRCKPLCPQAIDIPARLGEVSADLEKFPAKLMAWAARRFL